MGVTDIEWTATVGLDGRRHKGFTFNPWIGCTEVSPACDNCYARTMAQRYGWAEWGANPRHRTSTENWRLPIRWDRTADKSGARYKVFCASLADVFDNQVPEEWRVDLWFLIASTPHLDWLLLTKRPQNIAKMLPADWGDGWRNVWLGCTVENQEEANRRIPHLVKVPATVRFLSCEPMLGPVDLTEIRCNSDGSSDSFDAIGCMNEAHSKIGWVIAGNESGPGRRPGDLSWMRSLRDQCADAGVPFFGKQDDKVKALPPDLMVRQFPVIASEVVA